MLEEDVFAKTLTLEQQHMVICEVRQMLARMVDCHERRMVSENEMTPERARDIMKGRNKIRSGMRGVPGTNLGSITTP